LRKCENVMKIIEKAHFEKFSEKALIAVMFFAGDNRALGRT